MNYPQYSLYQPMQPSYPPTYLPRMEQPVQQMQPMTAQQPGAFLKGRPVTSEEEARGIPVDFDGSVMVFPDAAHGMIYTKQLNMQDGTAIFRAYRVLDIPPAQTPAPVEYAQKQELDQLRELVMELQGKISTRGRKASDAE